VRRGQPLLDDVAGELDAAGVERRTPLQRYASAGHVCHLHYNGAEKKRLVSVTRLNLIKLFSIGNLDIGISPQNFTPEKS